MTGAKLGNNLMYGKEVNPVDSVFFYVRAKFTKHIALGCRTEFVQKERMQPMSNMNCILNNIRRIVLIYN